MVAFEVGARDWGADPFEIGGDLAADIAAIEVVQPGIGELLQGGAERLRLAAGAGLGRRAAGPEAGDEARRRLQGLQLVGLVAEFGIRDRIAFATMADRVQQQFAQRHAPAERVRELEGELPAADGSGHGHRRFRAARRNGVVALAAIVFDRGERAGRAAGFDAVEPAAGLMNQPEAIAADAVHMRVDHGDRRRHRDHGLDGVAAFGENGPACFGGKPMRSCHGSGGEDRRIQHQGFSSSRNGPSGLEARICCMGRQAPLGA